MTGPVLPGSGWPDDPATSVTPVAADAGAVRALAASAGTLAELAARQSVCRACARLVAWRERVAADKRRSFRAEPYWGRPVPGWGAEQPRVLIIGLAPAAHGGNRTGRIFTGDRSGDVLFGSLYRCGLAARPDSIAAGDGQRLDAVRMVASVRCAPPANKPSVAERDACAPWLAAELKLVAEHLAVIVCLGHFAWQAIWPQLAALGLPIARPRPVFGHGAEVLIDRAGVYGGGADRDGADRDGADRDGAGRDGAGRDGAGRDGADRDGADRDGADRDGADGDEASAPLLVLGCYHPSQQNTFTGRVTDIMLDVVFQRAREQAGL